MGRLSIGQMAEQNCVSRKTLRVYHDMGILVPAYVDSDSGFRYYDQDQRYVLDFIQQLQSVGLSLDEIKNVLESDSEEDIKSALRSQAESNRQKTVALEAASRAIDDMLRGVEAHGSPNKVAKPLPPVQIGPFDGIPALFFSCEELGVPDLLFGTHPCGDQWNIVLSRAKKAAAELLRIKGLNIPVPLLFHRVGVAAKAQEWAQAPGVFREVFLGVDEATLRALGMTSRIPSGNYLSIANDCTTNIEACGGKCVTATCTQLLFDYAKKHGFDTDGVCYTFPDSDLLALRNGKSESASHTILRIVGD